MHARRSAASSRFCVVSLDSVAGLVVSRTKVVAVAGSCQVDARRTEGARHLLAGPVDVQHRRVYFTAVGLRMDQPTRLFEPACLTGHLRGARPAPGIRGGRDGDAAGHRKEASARHGGSRGDVRHVRRFSTVRPPHRKAGRRPILTAAFVSDTVIHMEEVLTIRLPKGTRRRLERRAKAQKLSVSQLVRRALDQDELLTSLASARAELVPQARAQGVYTDEDVFAIVS